MTVKEYIGTILGRYYSMREKLKYSYNRDSINYLREDLIQIKEINIKISVIENIFSRLGGTLTEREEIFNESKKHSNADK